MRSVLCRRPREGGWPVPLVRGRPWCGGASSTHHMLHGVGVERDHANGSCPLVVFLMDFLVEHWVVKEPGK